MYIYIYIYVYIYRRARDVPEVRRERINITTRREQYDIHLKQTQTNKQTNTDNKDARNNDLDVRERQHTGTG